MEVPVNVISAESTTGQPLTTNSTPSPLVFYGNVSHLGREFTGLGYSDSSITVSQGSEGKFDIFKTDLIIV